MHSNTIMKHSIVLPALLFIFISATGFSQTKKYLYYFDKGFNAIDKAKSVFNGIGVYENGALEISIYNTLNNKLLLVEHYTDSSLQVENGLSQSYFENTLLKSEGNYVKGKEEGLWKQWDTLGHVIDSSIYDNGEKIMEVHIGYYKNGSLDSFIVNNIKADQLQKTYYDDKGNILSEVSFTGQNGIAKYYDKGIIKTIDTVNSRLETEASFSGGESAWARYITQVIVTHGDELTKDGQSGTCRVKFIIDKKGKIKDAEALTMQGSALARIAVNAIRYGPKWLPAVKYGRPVNAFREQPVFFTIENR